MEGKFLLLCAMFGLWLVEASEEVASSKVIADTNKGLSENPHGAKNASYFVNPKKFLTYEGQFDKIKSLGDEVRCKLHGSCSEKKHKVPRKINTKASKKSVASRPRDRMPDNHNNVLSPEALMNPVAGGILGGNEFSQQPEGTKRSIRSAPTEVLPVNSTTNVKDNSTETINTPTTNSSHISNVTQATVLSPSPTENITDQTPNALANITSQENATHRTQDVSPSFTNASLVSQPLVSPSIPETSTLVNSTTEIKNDSVQSSNLLNSSSITTNDPILTNSSVTNVAAISEETSASRGKDSKATKKTLTALPRTNEDLPPIYLTVKNGEKVLVVHPTTEFLQSLPRINFTDPASDKAASSGRIRSAKGYTGNYAKRDEMLLQMKMEKGEIGARKAKVKAEAEEEEGGNGEEEDNNVDDESDPDESDNDEGDDDNEGSSDESSVSRSKIAFASVPLFSQDPNVRLNAWIKNTRSKISQRDLIKNIDSLRGNNQLGNIYTAEEYMKGERKSNTELPVPRAIQNLYRKFHPEHSKANFQYIPSRDEVAEELQYAQQSASLNRAMQGNVEQNSEAGELQAAPEADYASNGDVGDSGAATTYNNEPSWEQKYKNLDSDGRKRSENPAEDYAV